MTAAQTQCPECKCDEFTLVETPGYCGVVVRLGWYSVAPVDFYLCLYCGFGQHRMSAEYLKRVREHVKKKQKAL